jgi:hypothetical protein
MGMTRRGSLKKLSEKRKNNPRIPYKMDRDVLSHAWAIIPMTNVIKKRGINMTLPSLASIF